MMNEKRREDMARRIALAATYRPFAGATVLEIGADKEGFAAQMLVDAGARHVISTNFGAKWPHETVGPIERLRLDARHMPATFPSGSIDIIFGVAVLEHIDRLDMFFEGARQILGEGGIMFAHGGPIWSSARGHHVGLKGEAKHYRFGNNETNPIRDWTHLIFDKQSLAEDLMARDIPTGDAEKIAEQVYEADDRNRVGYRSMCETFEASGLNLIERIDHAFKGPPPELLEAIERGPWSGQGRYEVSGITFVAKR
ncbi:MAG TPA: methyltransferase domain-containing protein [Rhizomicrobium sp.]|nr:methyltransferase domain-containing protein [Rhizomicrobium sp.]